MADPTRQDLTLLALVIDDPLAPRVLAAWRGSQLLVSQATAAESIAVLADLADEGVDEVAAMLRRLLAAHLLVDRDISAAAEQLLIAYVSNRLRPPKKKPTPA